MQTCSYIMEILALLFIIGLISSQITYSNAQAASGGISVLDNGAVGDGKTDSTQGFLKAWIAACSATTESSKIIVPAKNTFLVKQITFKGPCKPKNITFEVAGTILAPNSPTAWNGLDAAFWVAFDGVTGLSVDGLGTGTFDGRGKGWWDQSCRYHKDLKGCTKLAPTSLRFESSKQITLKGIKIIQSPQTHVLFFGCDGVTVTHVECNSPKDSPNTDGIHIQACHGMTISDCKIANGDDNISIGDHTSDLEIFNIECGPGGHGISVGSLGKDGGQVDVKNIHVKNVSFTETTNGARIKTWQVGKGFVKNITYEDMKFNNCESPIVIDQNYCEVRGKCKEETTGVAITDVTFKGFKGTAALVETVQIACSKAVPCAGITLDNIDLSAPGKEAKAICSNARGTEVGTVKPGPCLAK